MKLHQNKMSPNNGILFNGVLIPKLLNNPFACCTLINFDFLLSHIAHVDKIRWLFLKLWELYFQYFFLHFKQYDDIVSL